MDSTLDIFVKAIFSENMIFAYFLGMCSYLAVSKTVKTAVGLGAAVIVVLLVTVPVNYLLENYMLKEGALSWLDPSDPFLENLDLSFLSFISSLSTYCTVMLLSFPSIYNGEELG